MNHSRIAMDNRLQRQTFERNMETLRVNERHLSEFERDFYIKLRDGYELAGQDFTVTLKQMNYLNQVAYEVERG